MRVRVVEAVTLARRPQGAPVVEDFQLTTTELPALEDGRVHVRTLELSLDPYLRSLLDAGHMGNPALPIGGVVSGSAVAEVVDSMADSFTPGMLVIAQTGWQAEAVLPADGLQPITIPPDLPPSAALGALGMPGLTAYAAHVRHLKPSASETIVISSATGGVGSVSGALARLAGARTIAIVGNRHKADLAVAALGYSAAVVRTEPGWTEDLKQACPEGVSCYIHMGDQQTLDGVMEQLAVGARVSLVGVMDQYNGASPTRLRAGAVIASRATLHGMVVYDHLDLAQEHAERVAPLLRKGEMVMLEDRYQGLAQAADAFTRLMSGANVGKVVVEVATRKPE